MNVELSRVLGGAACVLWTLGLALAITCGFGRWYLRTTIIGVPRRCIRFIVRLTTRSYRGVIRLLIVRPLRWLGRRWWEAIRVATRWLIERLWKW